MFSIFNFKIIIVKNKNGKKMARNGTNLKLTNIYTN